MAIHRIVRGGVPSPYPRFLFHGLRSAQLIGSVVVSGIMCYFIYYLRKEDFAIPWTFILLFSVSLATIAALTVTIILYNFTYLSPRFNLSLNGGISLFWALGLSLLSWSVSTSHVLMKQCSKTIWNGEAEASVCRDYKALWAMTLIGTVSTFLALALDVRTQKSTTELGMYNKPEDDKDTQMLNDLKTPHMRSAGYDTPGKESHTVSTASGSADWQEEDIGYHNRYGAEEKKTHGPLEAEQYRDMGYHNRLFKD